MSAAATRDTSFGPVQGFSCCERGTNSNKDKSSCRVGCRTDEASKDVVESFDVTTATTGNGTTDRCRWRSSQSTKFKQPGSSDATPSDDVWSVIVTTKYWFWQSQ